MEGEGLEGEGLEDVMRLSILYSGGRGIGGCDETVHTLQWRERDWRM